MKGILIKAAERGYITQLACKMPECFCPEELGGACYFEPVTAELSDWMPTHEHFPLSKREGGKGSNLSEVNPRQPKTFLVNPAPLSKKGPRTSGLSCVLGRIEPAP